MESLGKDHEELTRLVDLPRSGWWRYGFRAIVAEERMFWCEEEASGPTRHAKVKRLSEAYQQIVWSARKLRYGSTPSERDPGGLNGWEGEMSSSKRSIAMPSSLQVLRAGSIESVRTSYRYLPGFGENVHVGNACWKRRRTSALLDYIRREECQRDFFSGLVAIAGSVDATLQTN